MIKHIIGTTVLGMLLLDSIPGNAAAAESAPRGRDSLIFDTNKFTVKTLTVGRQTVTYRAYEGIVYVANPVDPNYECLNFYAPVEYYEGKSVGGYTAETAPIFFPNSVGGYMPGRPGTPDGFAGPGGPPPGGPGGPGGLADPHGPGGPPPSRNSSPSAIAVALAKGLVVAAPGARGRTLQDQSGHYTGKAPACIVDLKAAVRYLRHNDKIMPGDAEKIISNGTSAGGALSALVGATGNSPDYEPYLKAIGAADERDDIFAASCYCPITDLDNADIAYEWLFNGINTYANWGRQGTMTPEQINVSDQLKPLFPAYLNGLGLKKADGTALSLDADGSGPFKDYVKSLVIASAQKALAGGKDLSGLTWLTLNDGTVTDMDFGQFIVYATRKKSAPAFDSLDDNAPEVNLFGTATINNQHFTQFSKDHSTDHSLAEAAIVKMMNPMNYIGTQGVTTAPHWRIRHGTVDRDTSLAIPVILATKLQNRGFNVDFAMPWGVGHSGDYDLSELFAWINQICC